MSLAVKFAAVNGSIGLADEVAGRVYVTWCYGKAQDGSPITAVSSYADYSRLVQIPTEMYKSYTSMRAWSEEQRVVDSLIEQWLETKARRRRVVETAEGTVALKGFDLPEGCVCPCPPCICQASEKKS